MINYTKRQLLFLKRRRCLSRAALTAAFNKKYATQHSVSQIAALCGRKGFRTGRTGRFPKGHIPWDKGTMGMGVCKPNRGSFKKGHMPANHKPVGSERIDTDGYIYVKTAEPNVWRMKHVLVWEEMRGPAPKGLILRFRDGNSLNCRFDNLELMNRNLHARLNQLHYKEAPKKFKQSIYLIARIRARYARNRSQNESVAKVVNY